MTTMRDAELVRAEVLVDKPKRFVREVLRMSDGQELDWYFVDTPPSVMVVPVTEGGEVVLVKQYRHNLKRSTLELPAGVVADGEGAPAAALRELMEETGYALAPGGELHDLGNYYALPSETNKYVHFYLALGVKAGEAGEAGEAPSGDTEIEKYFEMEVVTLPFEEAFALVGTAIHGLETAGALLLARQMLGST